MTALAAPSPPPALQLLEIPRVLLRLCALTVGCKGAYALRVIVTRTLKALSKTPAWANDRVRAAVRFSFSPL